MATSVLGSGTIEATMPAAHNPHSPAVITNGTACSAEATASLAACPTVRGRRNHRARSAQTARVCITNSLPRFRPCATPTLRELGDSPEMTGVNAELLVGKLRSL